MKTMNRAWSAKLSKGVENLTLCNSPIMPGECLIHAWDALRSMGMDPTPENYSKNLAYAKTRIVEIKQGLAQGAKVKFRKLFDAELRELEDILCTK